MFNLSGSELIFLVIIALVVLGPDKLPDAMRKAGKAYSDFKKMTTGFQNEMKSVLDEPMREIRETAELAKSSAMFDTKPFTDSMKDLGNTVTKPAVKPVSGSMAGATPPGATRTASSAAVVGGSKPTVPAPDPPTSAIAEPAAVPAPAADAGGAPPVEMQVAMWPTEPDVGAAAAVREDPV